MAIGVIAKLTVAEGKNEEFEASFTRLMAAVKENEKDCNFYAIHQSRTDPQTYMVLEQYASEEALAAHGKSDHFRSIGPELAPCMAKAPEIEYLDAIQA